MKLITSKGRIYDIDWIDTISTGTLYMQMENAKRLPEIAEEFDGLEWLKREDENQGDKLFEGYSILTMIRRDAPGVVILTFEKAGDK